MQMSKRKAKLTLELPEDFLLACKMFNIHPLEALQFYISKATVYSNLAKNDTPVYSLASTIFDQCLYSMTGRGKMGEFKRVVGVKYVKVVLKIIMSKIDAAKKEKTYKRAIEKWYAAIESEIPPKTISGPDDLIVLLTKDFCILCDIFRCTPLKVLQHYVNHISIPKYINSSSEGPVECATAFFLLYPPIIRQRALN
jgi:hypothetical protein